MDKNLSNKTEKELLDEAMENWPEELEQEAAQIYLDTALILENNQCEFASVEEIRKVYNSIPWEEYKKKWIK